MKLYEESNVTCIKENDFNLEVGKEYMITYLEWDSKTGQHSEVWLDDGSKKGLKITIKEFAQIFEIPYSFEETVIDVILNTIKDNQEYLTQPENLPQLAKLGYMYNTLWYAGRVCWGSDGVLSGKNGTYDCEDNPKYKIEMCNPKNEKIENFIYDAWGMHVSNDGDTRSYDDFLKILFEKRELSEHEVKMLKINKTFDEWVEVLTDEEFKYNSIYPNRRSVANHLLCTIGNGYGINSDGFVISEAGGADQDKSQYGDWENVVFSPEIEKIVREISSLKEVKDTINANAKEAKKWEKEKSDREKGGLKSHIGEDFTQEEFDTLSSTKLWDKIFNSDKMKKALKTLEGSKFEGIFEKEEEPYHPYYPVCDYSIIDIMINPNSLKREGITEVHQSYIDAGIEICKEILEHEKEENKRHGNVEFAKKFLAIQGFEEYKEFSKIR